MNTVLYKRRKIEKYRNDLRGLCFRDIAITNLHKHQHVHHDTPCYTVVLCRRLQMHVFHCPLHIELTAGTTYTHAYQFDKILSYCQILRKIRVNVFFKDDKDIIST